MARTVVITNQGIPGSAATGYSPGGTDVAVSDGGTGASSAAVARTNLGLGNVDNTSDANKPVSGAQAVALDTKAALVDEITRFPSDMYINVAGPTLVNYGDAVCMNLRQAVNDYVTFRCMIPLHWQTFDVDVYWTLALSVAGSPTLRIDYKGIGVGDATNAVPSVGTNHTSTAAGAPFVLRKSTVLANIVAEPTKALFIRVFRLASGGDGLAANIGVERVTLRRSL